LNERLTSFVAPWGGKALRIEHIGSTSIHGMASKPILDIVLVVVSLTQATELIPVVETLGYEYYALDTIPERMFFVKEDPPENRTHHLNLTKQGSVFWKNTFAFRDYSQAHDQIGTEYTDLKKCLAEKYAQTHQLDPDGKPEFVARVLELAEKEEGESS